MNWEGFIAVSLLIMIYFFPSKLDLVLQNRLALLPLMALPPVSKKTFQERGSGKETVGVEE